MHLYWLFLAPILLAIALFLSEVLIKEKKRVGLIFLGILSVFDLYLSLTLLIYFEEILMEP